MEFKRFYATMMERQHWYLSQLAPESSAYTIPLVLHCTGKIDIKLIQNCIKATIESHDIFRTGFVFENGDLYHVVHTNREIGVPVIETNQPFFDNNSSICREQINRILFGKFDIVNGPLVRCSILKYSNTEIIIALAMHHVISDLETIRIFLDEVSKRYNSFNNKNIIYSKSPSYLQFSQEYPKTLKGKGIEEMRLFWKKEIESIENQTTIFPEHDTNISIPLFSGGDIELDIPVETSERIKEISTSLKVNPFTVLLSVYYLLLYGYKGQKNMAVGIPFTNRRNELYSETPGDFTNILPLNLSLDENDYFRDVIKKMRRKLLLLHRNQEMPLELIVSDSNRKIKSLNSSLYQAGFTFEPKISLLLNGTNCNRVHVSKRSAQLDLYAFFRYDEKENIKGYFEFSNNLGKNTAEKLSAGYLSILAIVLNNIDFPIEKTRNCISKKQSISNTVLPSDKISKISVTNKTPLNIAATFTANNLSESIEFWINRLKLDITTRFTEYGQVMQQLLDPTSVMRTNENGYNVILLRFDDLCYSGDKSETFSEIISSRCDEILSAVASCGNLMFFIFFCPPAPALTALPGTQAACNDIQAKYTKLFNDIPGVYATGWDTILSWYPVDDYHDQIRLDNGHIPYTDTFFTVLSTAIIRRIFVISQKPVKIIATDCDNTLWKGVVAEDGLEGIEVNEEYRMFQKLLLQQSAAGKLLAVISKNREEDVNAVFTDNYLMLLTEDSIHSRRINWNRKSDNIQFLAEELNLGLESFLFIDDNPVECAEVNSTLSQVLTLKFPGNSQRIPDFLNGLWMLDYPKITKEDRRRSEYYHIEKQRNVIKAQTRSLTDFLEKLDLEVTFEEMNQSNGERLSQLTYRTNQFNFTGSKYSYHQLRQLQESEYYIYAVLVKDRFGDYGNVGMVVFRSEETLMTVETFLLSCRVLGRGVEYQILQMLKETCSRMNISQLQLQYKRTDRNQPALNFIDNLVRQCPSSKRENGALLILVKELSQISAVSNKNSRSHIIEQTRQSDLHTKIADQSSFDIMERNRRYIDIVENLSSIDKISKELQLFMDCKYNRTDISGKLKPAASPLEKKIAEIWKRILHIKEVDTYTNFFDTGGTSLQLPQVLADLETSFNVKLMLVDLFKYTTIHTQAEFIQNIITPVKKQKTTKSNSVNKRLTGIQAMRQRQQRSRSRLNTQ